MEDADGILSILERSIETIDQKCKEVDECDRQKMGYSRQKGTWNNTTVLSASVVFNISNEMTIEGLMSTLAKLYEKPSTSNKVFLMKHFFNMKMSEGGFVVDHLSEFNMITNQFSFLG